METWSSHVEKALEGMLFYLGGGLLSSSAGGMPLVLVGSPGHSRLPLEWTSASSAINSGLYATASEQLVIGIWPN